MQRYEVSGLRWAAVSKVLLVRTREVWMHAPLQRTRSTPQAEPDLTTGCSACAFRLRGLAQLPPCLIRHLQCVPPCVPRGPEQVDAACASAPVLNWQTLHRSIALALALGLLAVAHAARPMPSASAGDAKAETFFGDHGFPPMPALPPHDFSLDLSHPPLPALPPHEHEFDPSVFSHPPLPSLSFDKPALPPLHSEDAKKDSFFGDHAFPPVAFPPAHTWDPSIFSHPPLPAHDFSLDLSHPPLPSLTFDKPALPPHEFDKSVVFSHPPLPSLTLDKPALPPLHSEDAKKDSFFGDHAFPPVAFPPAHTWDPSIFSHPPLPALPPHDFSLDLSHPPLPSLTFDKPALPPHEFDKSVVFSHPPLPSLTHAPIVLVRPTAQLPLSASGCMSWLYLLHVAGTWVRRAVSVMHAPQYVCAFMRLACRLAMRVEHGFRPAPNCIAKMQSLLLTPALCAAGAGRRSVQHNCGGACEHPHKGTSQSLLCMWHSRLLPPQELFLCCPLQLQRIFDVQPASTSLRSGH